MVFYGQYMTIYELDTAWDFLWGGNGSDWVDELSYPGLVATVGIWCRSANECSGTSSWLRPTNPGVTSANIQIHVQTRYYY